MQEAMVTARMSKEKKEAGTRVLKSLGQTPSEAINELYDYLIAKRENPCALKSNKMKPGVRKLTADQVTKGKAFLDEIAPSAGVSAPDMTKDEMRREVLIGKGLLSEDAA